MTHSVTHLLRQALLLVVGFSLGLVGIGILLGANTKNAFLHLFGIGNPKSVLATGTSCTVPAENSNEIYFVSCGGFF